MWKSSPIFFIALLLRVPAAPACSYGFDNNAFPVTDNQLLSLPAADFHHELLRCGIKFNRKSPDQGSSQDVKAELADLRAALEADRSPTGRRNTLIERYAKVRSELQKLADPYSSLKRTQRQRARLDIRIPADLPEEFNLYLRGAAAYHQKQFESARYWWTRLLELPPQRRKFRTVWAAYMIGRTHVFSRDPADARLAIEWMARARALAARGFADSQNLARASLGWQARVHFDLGEYEHAFELYFALADGPSLAIAAHAALRQTSSIMQRLARHELSSRIITALVVARGGPWRPYIQENDVARWLVQLERERVIDLAGADRIAWAAYQNGDIAAARRWLARADPQSPMSRWLASKFLLRDGKVDDAAAILAGLVHTWPANSEWNAHQDRLHPSDSLAGELGVLHLHRGRYVEAMDLMLRAGLFRDAAYVAERVLTPEELKAYIDQHWPASLVPPGESTLAVPEDIWQRRGLPREQVPMRIRYLLARRLARLGRHPDAAPYYPAQITRVQRDYTAALRGGDDRALSKDERGESLWQAAQLARRYGMELMATELDPDFFTYGGMRGGWREYRRRPEPTGPITTPTPDERRRANAHSPAPAKRFHYRYLAADHAWAAAQLLPDESDLKAQVLHQAGQWLMAQDAPAADRFYKALVRQCGTTRLGRHARRLRWFP